MGDRRMNKLQKMDFVERRHIKDNWHYGKSILMIMSWLSFLFALIMSFYAAPEHEYGVTRYYGIEVRHFWLTPLTGYLYIALWFSALASYLALMIRKYRSRRNTDNTAYNQVFLLIVNLVWLIYILYQLNIAKN